MNTVMDGFKCCELNGLNEGLIITDDNRRLVNFLFFKIILKVHGVCIFYWLFCVHNK